MTALAAPALKFDDASEDEVEMAIQICGGDVRAALRISLIANAFLEAELDRMKDEASAGYRRGRLRQRPAPAARADLRRDGPATAAGDDSADETERPPESGATH